MEEQYLIACLRHKNCFGNDFLLLWGPNRNGYCTDINRAGLYAKKEMEAIADYNDIPVPLSFLGIDPKSINRTEKNADVWQVVFKTNRVIDYINQQVKEYKKKLGEE